MLLLGPDGVVENFRRQRKRERGGGQGVKNSPPLHPSACARAKWRDEGESEEEGARSGELEEWGFPGPT